MSIIMYVMDLNKYNFLFLGIYVMNVNYNEFLFLFVKYIYKKQLILFFFTIVVLII